MLGQGVEQGVGRVQLIDFGARAPFRAQAHQYRKRNHGEHGARRDPNVDRQVAHDAA